MWIYESNVTGFSATPDLQLSSAIGLHDIRDQSVQHRQPIHFPLVDVSDIASSWKGMNGSLAAAMAVTAILAYDGINSSTSGHVPPPPSDATYYDYVMFLDDLSTVKQPWSDDPAFLPTAIVYSLAFALGFVGNLFVVVALLADRKFDSAGTGSNGGTSGFLVSLAAADVVFLVVCLPYELGIKLGAKWPGGRVLCKMATFVEMMTATASVLNLTAVSIERYVVIVHPLKSRTWCSSERTNKIIIAVWLASAALSSPVAYVMDTMATMFYNNDTHVVTVTCVDNNVSSNAERIALAWYQLIVIFLLPVATIVYCYAFVISVLWLSTKRLARLTQTDSQSASSIGDDSVSVQRLMPHYSCGGDATPTPNRMMTGVRGSLNASRSPLVRGGRRHSSTAAISTRGRLRLTGRRVVTGNRSADIVEARKQVIRLLLAIVTVFFCCWGPRWILNVLKRHHLETLHTNAAFYVMLVVHLLPYVQSAVNPVIYSFMSHNFRRNVSSLWRRLATALCRRRHLRMRSWRRTGSGFSTGNGHGGGIGGAASDDWKFVELQMDTRCVRTASLSASHVTPAGNGNDEFVRLSTVVTAGMTGSMIGAGTT